ncbi:MAG: hypothetical protein Q8O12_03245 [Candidatus Omnitrophota bacterium]|nr:hypothetical protein [Candidatus Omnitrophota bacterium]
MNVNCYSKVLIAVVAALLVTSAPLRASDKAENVRVVQVSGEISEIDVKRGKLELEQDASRDRRDPTRYSINQNDTRVVDPRDKKFLKLEDLQVGQHVLVEFNYINGEIGMDPVAQKIIAEHMSRPVFQEASGELKAIDAQAGTLAIEERPGTGKLTYFVFEPNNIIVMQSPSRESVRLALNPGDMVKVEFVVRHEKRHARSIMLYPASSVAASTTTVTTTSTTTTQ